MKRKAEAPAFRCPSCGRHWGILHVAKGFTRCAVCGNQDSAEKAAEAAKAEARRRAAIFS